MINAARAAGVEHIVYIGSWTVHAPEQLKGLASRFVPSEKLLKDAGGLKSACKIWGGCSFKQGTCSELVVRLLP